MVGGDDRVEPVEVAGVVIGSRANRALSSSSGIRLIVESIRNEIHKYKFRYQYR